MKLAIFATIAIGCQKPTPVVPTVNASAPAVACPAAANANTADVCDASFTWEGYVCVRCADQSGCLDAETQTYCATGPCAQDPACRYEHATP